MSENNLELKYAMRGKANLFDRYAYACLEEARHRLFLGIRIGSSGEEVTQKGVDVWIEKRQEFEEQIRNLSPEDRNFLLADSQMKAFDCGGFGLNGTILGYEKQTLKTEYSQIKPFVSDNLARWLHVPNENEAGSQA